MSPDAQPSKAMLWTGRVLSTLPTLLMLFTGSLSLMQRPDVIQGFVKYGYPQTAIVPIGIAEIVCALLYIFPRTAVLGAVFVTAYLGGATATHVRAGEPFIAPVVFGIIIWVGLYLREPRLWPLAPIRK